MDQCNNVDISVEGNMKLDTGDHEASVDATLFKKLVGCLRFVYHSRPEISYGFGLVSRFMSNPKQSHLAAAKRILRYLKGTLNYGILFPHQKEKCELYLVAYSDSDW